MADEGSSIWGAGAEGNATDGFEATTTSMVEGEERKAAPRLFDDLGDAGWGAPDAGTDELTTTTKDDAAEPRAVHVVDERNVQASDAIPVLTTVERAEEIGDVERIESNGFDEFDDEQTNDGNVDEDDDFGDFGDFDEVEHGDAFDAVVPAHEAVEAPTSSMSTAASSSGWKPLHLTPNATSSSIAQDIRNLIYAPLLDGRMYPFHDGAASQLSQDRIRQVEGPLQILAREESRAVWDALSNQPNLKPVDWMRSKTRRQYLIAVGVPINLDELNTTAANGTTKSLPPLALKLDNDEKRRDRGGGSDGGVNGTESTSSNGHGRSAKDREASKPPEFDEQRAKTIVALTEDNLTLQSVPALRTLLREVESLTRQASTVLTHFLSQREAHAADAEMYNGLIRDLVTGAAKRVSSTHVPASGTAARRVNAGSGRSSPAVGAGRSSSPRT